MTLMTEERYIGTKLNAFNLFLVPVFSYGGYYLLNLIHQFDLSKHSNNPAVGFLLRHVYEDFNFEKKIMFLSFSFLIIALFLFFSIYSAMLTRVFTGKSGIGNEDPQIATVFNRIIRHTVEQTPIFFGLLAYWLLNNAKSGDSKEALFFVIAFLATRILFYSGYLINYVIKIYAFRTGAAIMTWMVHFELIQRIWGVSFFKILN